MRARPIAATIISVAIGLTPMRPFGQQAPAPVFRSGRDLVSVDVVVRDRAGNILPGGTRATGDSLRFEENDAKTVFEQAYAAPIFRLLDVIRKHDKALVKKLVNVFAAYELKGSTLSLSTFAR